MKRLLKDPQDSRVFKRIIFIVYSPLVLLAGAGFTLM